MIIVRYVFWTVLAAMGLVLFVFIALNTVVALVDELGGTRGSYQVAQVLEYIALTTPRRIYELIPYVCLIGALAGLGVLAAGSELVVLRASGVSTLQLGLAAMIPALLFVALGAALGEWIAPAAEERAEASRAAALRDVRGTGSSTWFRDGNLFVRVTGGKGASTLDGISQYVFDDAQDLVAARRALRAEYRAQGDGWRLVDIRETRFSSDRLELSTQESRVWLTSATPQALASKMQVEPSKLSIADLGARIDYLESEGFDAGEFRLAVWRKLAQPLAILSLVLLAASFVSGPLREAGMGLRIAAGVLVGIGFKFVQDLLGPASVVFGFSPAIAVLLPVLICIVAALWLIRSSDVRRSGGVGCSEDDLAAGDEVRP